MKIDCTIRLFENSVYRMTSSPRKTQNRNWKSLLEGDRSSPSYIMAIFTQQHHVNTTICRNTNTHESNSPKMKKNFDFGVEKHASPRNKLRATHCTLTTDNWNPLGHPAIDRRRYPGGGLHKSTDTAAVVCFGRALGRRSLDAVRRWWRRRLDTNVIAFYIRNHSPSALLRPAWIHVCKLEFWIYLPGSFVIVPTTNGCKCD